jgi:hypothetical protein
MAEMVRYAVAEEIAKQIVSGILDKHGRKPPNDKEQLERLEMAHIKLEAALETSDRWQIRDASLLRWRKKLKRAAQECDDTLRRCKQRAVAVDEDEDGQEKHQRVPVIRRSSSSLPTRLVHATTSFVSSILLSGRNRTDAAAAAADADDDGCGWSGGSAVRRFEWFADGAAEFLRFVELGGTPWPRYTFFDPLIARLLAGEEARYRLVRGSQYYLFCVRPIVLEGRGTEAKLIFFYEDDDAPEKNLCIGTMLRLSESTDIVGITIQCLQLLVTPHFKSTAEAATRELANLPTQDFSWVPYGGSTHREHWDSIHKDMSQWFRPDPLCCNHHEPCRRRRRLRESNAAAGTVRPWPSQVSLESVIEVYWQCQVPLSEYNMLQRNAAVEGPTTSSEDTPYLKLGLLFTPHGSLGDLTPKAESSALEVIDGEEQRGRHTNLSLRQMDETMLPKALQCLYQKTEAMAYQMLWKSKHGAAYLQVRKTTPRKNWKGDNKNKRLLMQRHHQDPKLERWTHVLTNFLNLWVARAPDDRLRSSMTQWLQRANEKQLAVLRC